MQILIEIGTRIPQCLASARDGMLFVPTPDLQGINQPQFRSNLRSLEIETWMSCHRLASLIDQTTWLCQRREARFGLDSRDGCLNELANKLKLRASVNDAHSRGFFCPQSPPDLDHSDGASLESFS